MLCGEKAVISKILLLPAVANPVAWEGTVCWIRTIDRWPGGRRVNLLENGSTTDYGTLWLVRDVVSGAHGKSEKKIALPPGAVSAVLLISDRSETCCELSKPFAR